MWFKNLVLYRLEEPLSLSAEEISQCLVSRESRPCGGLEPFTMGFSPPLGRLGTDLVHAANGRLLITSCREERLLPPAVVREVLDERVAEIESRDARPVRAKERRQMRDEIFYELLPRAFTRSTYVNAFLNPETRWLAIDSASVNRAEDMMNLISHCVGPLKARPWSFNAPAIAMSEWLERGTGPGALELEDECELRMPEEDGAVVRVQREDLGSDEVRAHLHAGKQVHKLALRYADRLTFVLCSDMSIKRLRFESIEELDDYDSLSAAERFDVDFSLMSIELDALLEALVEALPN